ncbi:hypothetical protein [Thermus islandicus]|uniref:hypothetical protein n=1 Tax=Thermus islandicus TaxID=540988 RepID=UPI0003B497F3|nr:hypothetical protein [Thermus islandicus]
MEGLLLFFLALLPVPFLLRRRSARACPACGLPLALAAQVARYRRFCPHVAARACPFDPRRGVYRQRR